MDQEQRLLLVNVEEEMKHSYLDYAMSVIVGRALPDVRDGLKPVHRRILFAMRELGMDPDKPHKKSARVVGDVLAKYHPHGDVAVYDAMVRMAQNFSTRYPLVDGHGNFGSVDGDSAAAMRYTEARLSKLAEELLVDIDKDTVEFNANYDGSMEEPSVLPSRVPNLLINGSSGIAVGMATNIPPHNIGEVIDALIQLIDQPHLEVSDLMAHIKGPDFPTGGIIMGREGVRETYATGRGSIRIRAKTSIEPLPSGKHAIIVTEIPYQVNKAKLVERIAELARDKKIEGITDLRDESDRSGMRVVIELRREAQPQVVLNQLYKHTQMQETFGAIMLALVDGEARFLNLKEMLQLYLDHRKDVVTRRTKFLLGKAEARAHIVEGLRIALDYMDEVINTIRSSRTVEAARTALMENFKLTEVQAQAILDMRLQKLTGLEREKLEEEYIELGQTIEYYRAILGSEQLLLKVIKRELTEVKEQFADPRRTAISLNVEELEDEDLIPQEDVVITITLRGYIKRLPTTTYRSQKRGGRGIMALTTRSEDVVEHLFVTTTHHYFLFFTNLGLVYRLKVHEIPDASRQAKGTALVNLLNLKAGEVVTAVIPVRDFAQHQYLILATRRGVVKKTSLDQYDSSRRDGLIALHLDEGDELIGVKASDGDNEVVLATRKGLAIRFLEEEVRPMGRNTRGVRGISLKAGDDVVSMDLIRPGNFLVAVTSKGYGKITPEEGYRRQRRGGKGILTLRTTGRNGQLVTLKVASAEDELMLITREGVIIRLGVGGISIQGRSTQGVLLQRLDPKDQVVAVATIAGGREGEEPDLH